MSKHIFSVMKKLNQNVFYLIGTVLFLSSCGNDEGEPTPIDCSLNPISFTVSITEANCGISDGIIEVSATGGEGELFYSNDAGASFQETGVFNNLEVGNYSILVKDINDCESTSVVQVEDKGDVTITLDSKTDTPCGTSTGEIVVSSTGGSGNVQFQLGTGALQQSGTFQGLAAGTYELHAIDVADGCQATIEVVIVETGQISFTVITNANAGCGTNNGQISISASGGSGDYMYQIDNGTPQASNVFSSLSASTHTIRVIDDNGCESDDSVNVLSGVSFSGTIKNIIDTKCAISGCHNGDNGASRNWTVFANVQNNAANIKSLTQSRIMPQTGSLTQEQIDLIACWVDDGALNN